MDSLCALCTIKQGFMLPQGVAQYRQMKTYTLKVSWTNTGNKIEVKKDLLRNNNNDL